MNGRHNHPTLGKALHSAAVSLILNAEHNSVIYDPLLVTIVIFCWVSTMITLMMVTKMKMMTTTMMPTMAMMKIDEVDQWSLPLPLSLSLSDDSAQVPPTGDDSHS